MYCELIAAITHHLDQLFEGKYTIYTDTAEQGLTEPCFFVQFLESSEKPVGSGRYFRETDLCIQYIPKKGEDGANCYQVADILMEGMELIPFSEKGLIRGTQRQCRIKDGILQFFVNYNMFLYRQQQKEEAMEQMEVKKGLVK